LEGSRPELVTAGVHGGAGAGATAHDAAGLGAANSNGAVENGAVTGNGAVHRHVAKDGNDVRVAEGAHSVEAVGPEGREVFERVTSINVPR
jgi:hypothetical protein